MRSPSRCVGLLVLCADLVADGWLPEERAATCPQDYERQSDSWHALLDAAMSQ